MRKIYLSTKHNNEFAIHDAELVNAYNAQNEYEEFDGLTSTSLKTRIEIDQSNDERINEIEATVNNHYPRRGRVLSFDDEEIIMNRPIHGKLLSYCMDELDKIVSEPFVYFAKRPDPISIHMAMEYISSNEQSDIIYVIHFVDDRNLYNQDNITVETFDEQTTIILNDPKDVTLQQMSIYLNGKDLIVGENAYELPLETKQLVDYVAILDTFYV